MNIPLWIVIDVFLQFLFRFANKIVDIENGSMFISGHHRIRIQLFFWMWTSSIDVFFLLFIFYLQRSVVWNDSAMSEQYP